jgi:hypothetical protein
MGTFGRTQVLPFFYQLEPNEKVAEKFQLTESASVAKIMVHGVLWGSPYFIRGGIYSDEDGEPKNLLGQTQSMTYVNGFGWMELPFTTPVSLDPGWYWLTIHSSDIFHVTCHDWGETGISNYHILRLRRKRYDEYADGLESPWSGGEVYPWILSVYAVY